MGRFISKIAFEVEEVQDSRERFGNIHNILRVIDKCTEHQQIKWGYVTKVIT